MSLYSHFLFFGSSSSIRPDLLFLSWGQRKQPFSVHFFYGMNIPLNLNPIMNAARCHLRTFQCPEMSPDSVMSHRGTTKKHPPDPPPHSTIRLISLHLRALLSSAAICAELSLYYISACHSASVRLSFLLLTHRQWEQGHKRWLHRKASHLLRPAVLGVAQRRGGRGTQAEAKKRSIHFTESLLSEAKTGAVWCLLSEYSLCSVTLQQHTERPLGAQLIYVSLSLLKVSFEVFVVLTWDTINDALWLNVDV